MANERVSWLHALVALSALLMATPARGENDAGGVTSLLEPPPAPPPLVAARVIDEKLTAANAAGPEARARATTEIAAMGDSAVPALIVLAHDPSAAKAKQMTELLESMGKRTAADTVQTRRIDVLEAVLAAYASTHDEGAVPAVLSFVTSDKARVRAAARAAILAYGKTATPRLREEWMNLTGKPSPREWDDARLANELFLAYDRASRADLYALLDAAVDTAKTAGEQGDLAKLGEAVKTFDGVLAREPDLDRRADMVPGYVQYAQMIEAADAPHAREVLERALRLDPEGHRAAQIKSELAYLEAKELAARGITDRAGFARAAELDPGNTKARDEIARIDAAREAKEARVRAWSWSAVALGLAVALAILFVRRPRRS